MRYFMVVLVSLLMLTGMGYVSPLAAADKPTSAQDRKWLDARAANRKGREGMYVGAAADRVDRAKKASVILLELIKTAETTRVPGQDASFTAMITTMEQAH